MKKLSTFNDFRYAMWPRPYNPRPGDWAMVERIQESAVELKNLSDIELASRLTELRARVRAGEALLRIDVVEPCFAITNEAVRRVLGIEYYQVQLVAGLALATGVIAEMSTGEGKTVVALLPAALHALTGLGVHVATVNAYLAQRDFELLAPVYRLMGLSVGITQDQGEPSAKQRAYLCDITYGTGYEFGFDYLRDQVAMRNVSKPHLGDAFRNRLRGTYDRAGQNCQRGHAFAVIDEVDSVLIDEASTPLVLSTDTSQQAVEETPFRRAAELAHLLREGEHFVIEQRQRVITLTENGQSIVFESHASFPVTGLCRPWQSYVEQALRAEWMLQKDVDYVVQGDAIRIVDQYTGRIFSDRTWRDGLHQAVEVKEGVPVSHEKRSMGRISRQRYFGRYPSFCGMTGTVTGHERELFEFYRKPIVVIPERLPCQRHKEETRYFVTEESKTNAIVHEIQLKHERNQPVLVGTRTIDESETLAQKLIDLRIPHQKLNGLQTDDEADLIANAGQRGAITIATNMAGRGTDIGVDEDVAALGGLHVIATQRQESGRVDRQLIGRSARQGKPGSWQCFVSAEDELIQQFAPQLAEKMRTLAASNGEIHCDLGRELDRAQARAESHRLKQRHELFRHDQWLNEILTAVAQKDVHASHADACETPEHV